MGAGEAASEEALAAMEAVMTVPASAGPADVPGAVGFMLHNKGMATRKSPTPDLEAPEPKRRGRPTLAEEERRTARVAFRTYPEIADKAARLGNKAIEELIRKAREPE